MMRKKLAAIILTAGAVVAVLTGCSEAGPTAVNSDAPSNGKVGAPSEDNGTYTGPTNYGNDFTVQEFTYKLKDGREVTCIWADGYRSGGPSCDWENIKPSDR